MINETFKVASKLPFRRLAHAPQTAALPSAAPPPATGRPRLVSARRRVLLGGAFVLLLFLAFAYAQKDRYTDRLAELSRAIIGDERTARLESWYFAVQDRIEQLKFKLLGGATNPFGDVDALVALQVPPPAFEPTQMLEAMPHLVRRPAPLQLPQTRQLRPDPEQGEGMWTTAGLPHSSPEDVLMAKTFLRPDAARPYALVGVLLVDKRRVRLHVTGGTQDPGGDRGVRGPGVIPPEHRRTLLVAWNGGFRGPHGGFGMYADGRLYRPLRNGLASLVVYRDGNVKVGEWGRDLVWSDDIVAVRQNAVLLVDGCEVSRRTAEGNDTWGYVRVNSGEFITWRSAVGLTQNGDLLIAAGNSLSAATLARALWAAGACTAMQLDINTPYVLIALFFQQADGSIRSVKFMDHMVDNPARFLGTQANDFMYLTRDETRYAP